MADQSKLAPSGQERLQSLAYQSEFGIDKHKEHIVESNRQIYPPVDRTVFPQVIRPHLEIKNQN